MSGSTTFEFVNNFSTTLSAPIAPSDTTVSLAAALNASPSVTNPVVLTFNDKATGTFYEIVHVVSVSGNNLTIVRGQEGTAPLGWAVEDYAFSGPTAGQMQNFVQAPELSEYATETWVDENFAPIAGNNAQTFEVGPATESAQAPTAQQVQSNALNYGVDTSTVANQIDVAINPVDTLVDGQKITVKVANTNTGALLASVNGQGNIPIMMPAGLLAGSQQVTNLLIDSSAVANTITISVPSTFTSINNGQDFIVQIANTNTGATNLQILNAAGATVDTLPVQSMVGPLVGGELAASSIWVLRYNSAKNAMVVQGLGFGVFARVAGNASQPFASAPATQGNQVVTLGQINSRTFVSAPQPLTYVFNGNLPFLTLPHNLGALPSCFGFYLVNTTAELGYNVGDLAGVLFDDADGCWGNNPICASTQYLILATGVDYNSGTLLRVINQVDTGNADWTKVTPDNWGLIMWAKL